jgi:hypothetical protein
MADGVLYPAGSLFAYNAQYTSLAEPLSASQIVILSGLSFPLGS